MRWQELELKRKCVREVYGSNMDENVCLSRKLELIEVKEWYFMNQRTTNIQIYFFFDANIFFARNFSEDSTAVGWRMKSDGIILVVYSYSACVKTYEDICHLRISSKNGGRILLECKFFLNFIRIGAILSPQCSILKALNPTIFYWFY